MYINTKLSVNHALHRIATPLRGFAIRELWVVDERISEIKTVKDARQEKATSDSGVLSALLC